MFSDNSSSQFASIRSSLSSIYRNYDFHLGVIKITEICIILSLICTTLVLTSSLYEIDEGFNKTGYIHLLDKLGFPWNDTHCIQSFELPDKELYVRMCRYQASVILDIIKFHIGQATSFGLYLNFNQWNYLERLQNAIDKSIDNALNVTLHKRY
ncbi:unnamed protein product [Mytilus coruscus]|uniref:Uncharacterized protein n=1 Tax=Mytilus coruscus TaxID=42192 RepID=A0A6J8ATM9_MYTCO|nr:unnamed protein product [Mytilus coruscus]